MVPVLVAAAGHSRFRHRVWAGRSPAELVTKSSPWPIGWRQSSHRSAKASPGPVAGLFNCGGNHAEVFPNITLHVTPLSAAAWMQEGLHSGCAHSSVSPKTNRHVQGDVASAAITTSVAGPEGTIPRLRCWSENTARYWPNGEKVEKFAHDTLQAVKKMENARGKNTVGHWPYDDELPRMEYPIG